MKTMRFDVPQARNHLRGLGYCYTVRAYNLPNSEVTVPGVGRAFRHFEGEVRTKASLAQWVEESGFDCLDDWWDAIQRYCQGRRKYAYVVWLF